MLQDSFLFDMSVRDNIRYGKLDATDAEIEAAARAAEIHEAIQQLPQGYDTRVGERGSRLSGGQRQRLAIARALVMRPKLLLMDEPFAALDEVTRFKLNDDLLALRRRLATTIVFVTHSVYESVYLSSRIVVLAARGGGIVEEIEVAPAERDADFRSSLVFSQLCRRASLTLQKAVGEETP